MTCPLKMSKRAFGLNQPFNLFQKTLMNRLNVFDELGKVF
jgi:hypothetical protein|tara:strand:- start:4550 stop:4669 length:120 start_codon:yes stop_codon:yes gene_type:complete